MALAIKYFKETIVHNEPVPRKVKNGPNRTLITEDGKLRIGAFFIFGQGSYTIILCQWRENTPFRAF